MCVPLNNTTLYQEFEKCLQHDHLIFTLQRGHKKTSSTDVSLYNVMPFLHGEHTYMEYFHPRVYSFHYFFHFCSNCVTLIGEKMCSKLWRLQNFSVSNSSFAISTQLCWKYLIQNKRCSVTLKTKPSYWLLILYSAVNWTYCTGIKNKWVNVKFSFITALTETWRLQLWHQLQSY